MELKRAVPIIVAMMCLIAIVITMGAVYGRDEYLMSSSPTTGRIAISEDSVLKRYVTIMTNRLRFQMHKNPSGFGTKYEDYECMSFDLECSYFLFSEANAVNKMFNSEKDGKICWGGFTDWYMVDDVVHFTWSPRFFEYEITGTYDTSKEDSVPDISAPVNTLNPDYPIVYWYNGIPEETEKYYEIMLGRFPNNQYWYAYVSHDTLYLDSVDGAHYQYDLNTGEWRDTVLK